MLGGMRDVQTTFCRICEASCGLRVTLDEDRRRVVELRPDRDNPSSRGYACIKGVRFRDVHNSPDRLRHPIKRTETGWRRISWEQALSEIGARARAIRRAHGGDALGMYIGNPAAFSLPHSLAIYGFMRGLGSRSMYGSGSQDCNNKFLVARRMYGASMLQPIPDIARTGCLICLGTNPAVSHASFVHLPRPVAQLKALARRGGALWQINPRRTETAQVVGEHVFIRPGTDVFLLLAFLAELEREGGVARQRVARYMRGWEEVAALVRPWTPARAEAVTGVAAATTRAMVRDYLRASRDGRGAALYCSTGVNQSGQGTLAFWLLNVINAVSGNLDRAGGLVVPRGLLDLPRQLRRIGVDVRRDRSRIGGFEAIMDTFPAGVLADEIETPGPGQLRGMFVSAGNPLLSCADEPRLRAALSRLELLVSVDMFRNETGNLAHYVLPATSFLERPDIPLSSHGFSPELFVQLTDAVAEVDGEQRDEWWIYNALARACGVRMFNSRLIGAGLGLAGRLRGGADPWPSLKTVVEGLVLSSARVTPGQLRRRPHGMMLPFKPDRERLLGRRLMTRSRRVELAPADFVARARAALEPAYARELEALARPGTLRLISRRSRHGHNSWMHNVESMVAAPRDTNRVDMHPEDARAAGLRDGALARVARVSDAGELEGERIELPVRVTEELMPGTVSIAHGWGHQRADGLAIARETSGVNVNRVAPSGPRSLEPLSGMTRLCAIPVRVWPAASDRAS